MVASTAGMTATTRVPPSMIATRVCATWAIPVGSVIEVALIATTRIGEAARRAPARRTFERGSVPATWSTCIAITASLRFPAS